MARRQAVGLLGAQALHNNAMQLTRGVSEASGLRRPHHHLVPLAADRECYPDHRWEATPGP